MVMLFCGPDEANQGFRGRLPVCIFTVDENQHVVLVPMLEAHRGLINETRTLFGDKVFNATSTKVKTADAFTTKWGFAVNQPVPSLLCIELKHLTGNLTSAQRALLPTAQAHCFTERRTRQRWSQLRSRARQPGRAASVSFL